MSKAKSVILGVDYGSKSDFTAVVYGHMENGKVIIEDIKYLSPEKPNDTKH